MLTVLSVIGTRPEAIKMAPVVKEFEKHSGCIRSVLCSTSQHRLCDSCTSFQLNCHDGLRHAQANSLGAALSANG